MCGVERLESNVGYQAMPVVYPEDNVTRGELQLGSFAHEELVKEAIEALHKGPGVFISGQPGAGKRTLVTSILRQLHGEALIIDLGFPESNAAALAFNKVLEDCATQEASTRFMALGSVNALLKDESMGLPIVVVVPEYFTLVPEAVAMLASLSLASALSILCSGTSSSSAAHQVHDDLMTAVHLHRIQLLPLDLEATHKALTLYLGGAVSRRAAHQLWTASGGKLQDLFGLIRDWQEQSYLLLKSDFWVVGGESGPIGVRSRELVASVLGGLNEAEREVIELVAMATEIPLNALMTLCDSQAIDAVFARGLVEISGKYSRMVKASSTYHARVAVQMTPPGRARTLLGKFRGLENPGYVLPTLRELAWEQSAGIRPTQELVDAAGKEALANNQPQLCLELLGNSEDTSQEIELTYLEALVRAGFLERAKEKVRSLRFSLGSRTPKQFGEQDTYDIANIFRLDLIEILLFSMQPSTSWVELKTELDIVHHDFEKWSQQEHTPRPLLAKLAGLLDIIESEICYRKGERPDIEKPYNHPQLTGDDLLRWQFLKNRQSVRSGKTRLGLKRGRELVMLLQHDGITKSIGLQVKQELADLYLISGEWQESLEVLNSAWVGGEESPRLTEINGLYSAVSQLFEANSNAAMDLLRVEVQQLRIYDPLGHLTLAAAAAALAAARLKKPDAGQLMAQYESLEISADWEISQGAALLHAAAKFELGRKTEALVQLRNAAESNAQRGNVNLELSIRLMMARFGDTENRAKLYACAQRCDSSTAEKVLDSTVAASNSKDEETSRYIAGTWPTDRLDHFVHSQGINEKADIHALESYKITSHMAQREVPPQNSDQASNAALALISSLTARQQRIVAEAASGASSREISTRLKIRVRTVEGHLYQIYQRVNVTNRAELLQLYSAAQVQMSRQDAAPLGGT